MVRMILAEWRYRLICAWTTDKVRRNREAGRFLVVCTDWRQSGARWWRVVWLCAWAVHFLLWPVRLLRRTRHR